MCELKACAMIPDCFNSSILPNYIPPADTPQVARWRILILPKLNSARARHRRLTSHQDQVNDCTRWRMQLPPPLNFVQVLVVSWNLQHRIICAAASSEYSLGFCVTWTSCSGNKMSVKPHNPILYRLQDCLGPGVNIGDSEQFSISREDNQWYILVKWSWQSHCVLHIVIHV